MKYPQKQDPVADLIAALRANREKMKRQHASCEALELTDRAIARAQQSLSPLVASRTQTERVLALRGPKGPCKALDAELAALSGAITGGLRQAGVGPKHGKRGIAMDVATDAAVECITSSWDPNGEASLNTYVTKCAANAVRNFLESENARDARQVEYAAQQRLLLDRPIEDQLNDEAVLTAVMAGLAAEGRKYVLTGLDKGHAREIERAANYGRELLAA